MSDKDLNTDLLFKYIKKQNEHKKKLRSQIYNKILHKIHNKIFAASKQEKYNIYFEIPGIILGEPIYNLSECSKYIFNYLQTNGFKVKLFNKNELKQLGIKNSNSTIIAISWENV